jgi:hypothetical protein
MIRLLDAGDGEGQSKRPVKRSGEVFIINRKITLGALAGLALSGTKGAGHIWSRTVNLPWKMLI